ncbi:MAG: hypothetical protein N2053_11335, partial [Chitinispirillaceae bacterium]|nr:hypothetical protein [Chitinispirillaceae bacterium]
VIGEIIPPIFVDVWWIPELIAPYKEGFIVVKQYTGGPSRSAPEFGIFFYVNDYKGSFYKEKGKVYSPLLNSTNDKIIFIFNNKFCLLDVSSGKKIKEFDPYLLSTEKASLDLKDNIVAYGIDKSEKNVIVSFDLNGNKLWEHEVDSTIQNNQPPVCGEDGRVYYISRGELVCLKEGKELWKSEVFPCVEPLMTNSKGNNLLVQSGFHIMVFDSNGKQKFKTLITTNPQEQFTAPPVIGGDGLIYVASDIALYCFK